MLNMANPEKSRIINHIPKPYASPEDTLVEPATKIDGILPRAVRTQTHLERYILKERERGRVPGIESITGRAKIGRSRFFS